LAVYITRRHPYKIKAGVDAAKDAKDIDYCIRCGNEAILLEKYENENRFKCSKCSYHWAVAVGTELKGRKKNTGKNKSGILIRDMSKKDKEQKKKEDTETVNTAEEIQEIVKVIREGFAQKKVLTFEYEAQKSGKSTRSVEPYKLEIRNNELILWAYCLTGEGIRVFKLGNIKNILQSDFTYEPKWEIVDSVKDV